MISNLIDVASTFNSTGEVCMDISKWQNTIVQFINPSGTINFSVTNFGQGSDGSQSPPNAITNNKFVSVLGTNITTGTTATSTNAASIFSFGLIGKYLLLKGTGVTVDHMIVFQTKPY